jgi:Cu(I)/Ag(I) efflux system protein CusF
MSKFLLTLIGGLLAAHIGMAAPAFAEPSVDGEVTKVDESAGKVTVKHGPIAKLDMEPMTMVFRVAQPDMLKTVKPGDKIKFDADRVNGAITITEMKKKVE